MANFENIEAFNNISDNKNQEIIALFENKGAHKNISENESDDNDAKNIDHNITSEIKSYKEGKIAEFNENYGDITSENREEKLANFIQSVVADFENENSAGCKAAIDIHKNDCADHQNRIWVKGVYDLANLDFEGALGLYPGNRYLIELAEIPKRSFKGIVLINRILENLRVHDKDKLSEDLLLPYAKICRADSAKLLFTKDKCNEKLNFNDEIIQPVGAKDACKIHVETNAHHPEYWIIRGRRMDTANVMEFYEDGKACASRFESGKTLKESNESSRTELNWGRLTDDDSCWKDLTDKNEVYEAVDALMIQSEKLHGDLTVGEIMRIAQENVKASEDKLKPSLLKNTIVYILSCLPFCSGLIAPDT